MKKILYFVIALVYISIVYQWFRIYVVGEQYKFMSLLPNILTGSFPLWGAFLAFKLGQLIKFVDLKINPLIIFAFGIAVIGTQSCAKRAQANQQTLLTTDCGVSWSLIEPGQAIPKCYGMCQCHYSVRVPDYPMQGESRFKIMFKGNVLANIEVSYDYIINDALDFITEAKYLGKMNAEADDASNSSGAYEMAENSVIDKRIKEVSRELILSEDVVDFSPSDLEDTLLAKVNLLLKNRGVQLSFLNFVPQFDEQTRLAIDVATAQKIYASKNLDDWGKSISVARAGATKITIENTDSEQKE